MHKWHKWGQTRFNPRLITENEFEAEQKRAQRHRQNLHDFSPWIWRDTQPGFLLSR